MSASMQEENMHDLLPIRHTANIMDSMMKYFWLSQFDIPAGSGYPLFGWQHLLCLFFISAAVFFSLRVFSIHGRRFRDTVLKAIPLLLCLLEIWKDSVLIIEGYFSRGFLPLHLCSLGIPLFFMQAYTKSPRWKSILGEISFCLIMPGAAFALLDPDWNSLYPMLNFFNLHSYIWHFLLILFPVLLLYNREIAPAIRHIHYELLFLLAVVPPIYIFDKCFDCNYLFVNWPVPDTPLEIIARYMGNPGYLAGYAVFVILCIVIIYIPFCFRR